jgi:hypothetical protein
MGHLLDINHKRFAFIHVPKCGGSFFKRLFGLKNNLGHTRYPASNQIIDRTVIAYNGLDGHWTYLQLLKALEIKNEDYEFIAIVRNPWARMVSDYFFISQTSPSVHGNYEVHKLINSGEWSFKEYVKQVIFPQFKYTRDMYTMESKGESLTWNPDEGREQWGYLIDDNGKLAVENVFRMETLNRDIETFLAKNGLDIKIDEEKFNTSRHDHYSQYYDDESIELVRDYEIDMINHFNYEF